MRAYQLTDAPGFDGLALTDRPAPVPGPGSVLIAVKAASLNFRDVLIAKGTYSKGARPLGLTPVSDGAGEIIAAGHDVQRLKVGDRVAGAFMPAWVDGELTAEKHRSALGGGTSPGVLAEQIVLPESGVVKFPQHLSFEEAACLPCAGVTAWYALFEAAQLKPGALALLLGTGGVSTFALQFAKLAGYRTIVLSSSDEKLARAESLGADIRVNYRKHPEWQDEVLRLTDGVGVDHVVEVGGAGTINKSLAALRHGGSMALMGALTGLVDRVDTGTLHGKNIKVQGTYVGSVRMFEAMNKALAASGLRPLIDRVFAFEEGRRAYEHLESAGHYGKVVIKVS